MREEFVTGNTLPDAYHKALTALNQKGDVCSCADWGCTQKELAMTMVVEDTSMEPMISVLSFAGPTALEQYRLEMLEGILDFESGDKWHYTYHDRMVRNPGNQIDFVVNELKREPSSRRAVICIRDNASDMNTDSPACLQHIQFVIRNGVLDCFVLFRSNDAVKATFMNAFALIMLQRKIADRLGIGTGTYTHRANSFHCYEKDYGLLDGYCRRIESEPIESLSVRYVDGWDEFMAEDRDLIIKKTVGQFTKELVRKITGIS